MKACVVGAVIALVAAAAVWWWIRRLTEENERQRARIEQLEEIASQDDLTRIYNRRMLNEFLHKLTSAADRYRQPLSIVFFDIDDFKLINDRYGHEAGDEVLVRLADIIGSTLRESDVFGRWGGDEFVILLPETTREQAREIVRLIHERVGNHLFVHDQHIRCAFGVVAYKFGDTPKELMRRADRKLYEAKGVDPVGGVKVSDDGGEL
jgi:polar amino acid transport system substrate-binding protein